MDYANYRPFIIPKKDGKPKPGFRKRPQTLCAKCNKQIERDAKLCRDCYVIDLSRRSKCPPKEELIELLSKKPATLIAKEFGVSDRVIGKWATKLGINQSRSYWNKLRSKNKK